MHFLKKDLKEYLDAQVEIFNCKNFIADDPVSIPHRYSKKEDIEISAFFAAVLAWGQRKTIISKCAELMRMMDDRPYDFIMHHTETDLRPFTDFRHRTFNGTDALYFIDFLSRTYREGPGLENLFAEKIKNAEHAGPALIHFKRVFVEHENFPGRTGKHISSPENKSACKRLNMFLRWMVRKDDRGVDFGLWNSISSAQLVCPCDVHVERVARNLGLIQRKQMDWETALELTRSLRKFDDADPVKYDFALFGIGLSQKSQ
ncbi:MAG: TIGR02757 family protein [Cyclobacteriaceae bacterium]|nr:TIGR02757 family protein [Cyclobacteriaceae bacterium]